MNLALRGSKSGLLSEACGGGIFASSRRDDFQALLCRFECQSLKSGFRWYGRLRLRGPGARASEPGSNGKGWTIGLREPQRDALIPPIEGQTRVGHQLIGGETSGLISRQDRGDNIGCEKGQPHNPRRIRSRDLFLPRDGLEGWAVR